MRTRIALVLIAFAALLAGCGGSSGDDSTAQSGSGSGGGMKSVTIADYTYEPADLTVPAGTTVAFTNEDSTPHTATSKDQGAFDSGSIDTDETGAVTLEEAGSFQYYCAFHPFMKGTITVE
jgi:plastocyanin